MGNRPGLRSPAGVCLLLLVVVLAGCSGPTWSSGEPPAFEQTARPIAAADSGAAGTTVRPIRPDTTAKPAAPPSTIPGPETTATPTETRTADDWTVAYAVESRGDFDRFSSVEVTLAVTFGGPGDRCGDGRSNDKPDRATATATPTPTSGGDTGLDCVRFGNVTVELTDDNGTAVGRFTVPGAVADHSRLVVRDVQATLANGTNVTVADDVTLGPPAREHVTANGTTRAVAFRIAPVESGGADYALDAAWVAANRSVERPAYELSYEGTIAAGEAVSVRVTRNGAPAVLPVDVVGAAERRYVTDRDGTTAVYVVDPSRVEVDVVIDDARAKNGTGTGG